MKYPISHHINLHFSAMEDRLIVTAQLLGNAGQITMVLSRRLVLLLLTNVLNKLPELTGLEKTPANYWQEVLQMGHQHAMEAKKQTDTEFRSKASQKPETAEPVVSTTSTPEPDKPQDSAYLATELTLNTAGQKLTLAFRGFPMPMTPTRDHAPKPIFALPLQVDNVHQLIELLIVKCQEAQWHLPLELPWIDTTEGKAAVRKQSLPQH